MISVNLCIIFQKCVADKYHCDTRRRRWEIVLLCNNPSGNFETMLMSGCVIFTQSIFSKAIYSHMRNELFENMNESYINNKVLEHFMKWPDYKSVVFEKYVRILSVVCSLDNRFSLGSFSRWFSIFMWNRWCFL